VLFPDDSWIKSDYREVMSSAVQLVSATDVEEVDRLKAAFTSGYLELWKRTKSMHEFYQVCFLRFLYNIVWRFLLKLDFFFYVSTFFGDCAALVDLRFSVLTFT
jgi:hypothetical protein